jgi:Virulence factor BrkB
VAAKLDPRGSQAGAIGPLFLKPSAHFPVPNPGRSLWERWMPERSEPSRDWITAFCLGALSMLAVRLGELRLRQDAAQASAPLRRTSHNLNDFQFEIGGRWCSKACANSTRTLSVLYRFGPCRPEANWRWITPGSLVAAVAWLGMSEVFSWYVTNFGNYDRTYGSLGAIVGFLTWAWLSLMVLLLGAELNRAAEKRVVGQV